MDRNSVAITVFPWENNEAPAVIFKLEYQVDMRPLDDVERAMSFKDRVSGVEQALAALREVLLEQIKSGLAVVSYGPLTMTDGEEETASAG